MNVKTIALVVVFATNIRICASIRYDNYTLYSVCPSNEDHLKFLKSIIERKYIDAKFWTKPKLYDYVQFIVNPKDKDLFLERVEHFQLKADVLIDDIQKAFDNQSMKQYFRANFDDFSWENYHSVEDIYQWLGDLALRFPSIDLEPIGKSAEGRDIFAVALKKSHKNKPVVIVEAGIHGHEWVALEFATYLIDKLLNTSRSGDSRWIQLANKYDWYVIPVVNPDGYIYNQKEDRMWKKNRRIVGSGVGVDLNRNFAYSFGKYDSSNEPADDNYSGPEPFSEPETQALSKFIKQKHERLKFYFAIHSYGQKFIVPYSDRVTHLDNFDEMANFAKQAIIKIYQHSYRKYGVGTTYDTLGILSSGDSASWVKKTYNVQYVFTIHLRDDGSKGLSLPPDQIIPTCKETMIGLVELMTARPKFIRSNMFSDAHVLKAGVVVLLFIISIIN